MQINFYFNNTGAKKQNNVVIFDFLYRPFVVTLLTVTEW